MGRILLALVSTLFLVMQVMAGTWTSNNFLYKPAIGARGDDEKAKFDSGLNRVDSRLANEKWLNDSLYSGNLGTAITAIGSAQIILSIPAGNWPLAADLTVPANLTLKLARGAVLAIATGKTLTINGPLEAGLYQIFSCAGTGKVTFGNGAVKETYAEWWGAVGDNATDNYASMQKAITMTANSQCPALKLLGATYYCSDTLEIPTSGINHLAKFALLGTRVTTTDKTNSPEGTVIRVPAGKDGLRTPIVNYTGTLPEAMARTAKHITISDIYVQGPMVFGNAFADTKGFRFGGVMFLRTHNIHAEGFGYGVFLEQSNESYFGGTTFTQNNYYGVYVKRLSPSTYNGDSIAWFENLVTVIDYIPVWFDGPRSVFVKSGQNVAYGLPLSRSVQPRVKITNCYVDSQIHFSKYMMENDEDTPSVQIDASGIGILTFDQSNFSTSLNRIVSCAGFFNQISITNSVMDRTNLAANPRPLVELTNTTAVEPNGWCYSQQVTLEGNSPPWGDAAVKNMTVGHTPYRDYVPRGFQQINARRECDDVATPGPVPTGTPLYTNANILCGKGRLYFNAAGSANVICYLPKVITGAEIIYVTAIVDDNLGAAIPAILPNGLGTPPTDWTYPYRVALETYAVGSRTFTKWLWCIVPMNKTLTNSPGLDWLALTGIYYNSGSPSASGIQLVSIYVDTRQTGQVDMSVRRGRPTMPSATVDGYWLQGDMLYNNVPTSGQPPNWFCTVTGNPGTWKATANLP